MMLRLVRVGGIATSRAPDGYWDGLSDDLIKGIIDTAKRDCVQYLASECHFDRELDVSKQREFFSTPCLHFPKMDAFKHYISENGNGTMPGDLPLADALTSNEYPGGYSIEGAPELEAGGCAPFL